MARSSAAFFADATGPSASASRPRMAVPVGTGGERRGFTRPGRSRSETSHESRSRRSGCSSPGSGGSVMGYFFGRLPISLDPVVTRKEYLDASDRAFESLAHEADRRDTAYRHALDYLAAGRPGRGGRALLSLRRPRA